MSTHHRPRLSPKSPGELNRADYFVTASSSSSTPSAAAPTSAKPAVHTQQQQQQGQPAISSPSSQAFNADFDSLMRPPPPSSMTTTAGAGQQVPQTPLHAPASSPFFSAPAATTTNGQPIRGEAAKSCSSSGGVAPPSPAHVMQPPPPASFQPLPPPPQASVNGAPSTFKMPTVPFSRRTSGAAGGGPMPVKSNRYSLFTPQRLAASILASPSSSTSNPTTTADKILILDIRTHTSFSNERLAGSINVCVPSTLLRRPAFGVDRVQDSLPPSDQARFDFWRAEECRAIVVLDQESVALVEGGGPASLLAKFENAGFAGELGWVKGGWNAVRSGLVAMAPSLEEQERLLEHGEREEGEDTFEDHEITSQGATTPNFAAGGAHPHLSLSSEGPYGTPSSAPHSPGLTGIPGSKKHARGGFTSSSASTSSASPESSTSRSSRRPSLTTHASTTSSLGGGGGSGRPVLQVRDLPMSAFQLSSTTAYRNSGGPPPAAANAAVPGSRDVEMASATPSSSATSATAYNTPSAAAGGGFALRQPPGMGGKRLKKAGFDGPPSLAASHASAFSRSRGSSFGFGSGAGGGSGAQTAGTNASGNGSGNEPSVGWLSTSSAPPVGGSQRGGGGGGGQMRASANPFFDNIRQNTEALSLERSLANLTPVNLPPVPSNYLSSLPPYLRSLVVLSPMSRADRLARQFYELEAAERERLEGTFRWHSRYPGGRNEAIKEWQQQQQEEGNGGDGKAKEQVQAEAEKWERFGISAGVELGNLNRFRNIFPYEHSRVHLKEHSPNATDYVNASHLALRGSSKRFIASQGPLPATFRDFWQMCEQEHVGVIVMLTNLQEGGRDKCGRYWVEQHQGEWDVHVEGDSAHEEEARAAFVPATPAAAAGPPGVGFFSAFDAAKTAPAVEKPGPTSDTTIRRTITVQRRQPPAAARSRKIRHIQYRAWPDFDIPADPSDVVSLVDEVDTAQHAYMREIGWNTAEHDGQEPPILAHCSAGVGRTGVFIMVSSLLDKFRNEHGSVSSNNADQVSMDVDGDDQRRPPTRPVLEERISDGVASSLAAGLSDSSLDERKKAGTAEHTATGEQPRLPPTEEPALEQDEPAFAGVNELREQRMSMVANYRQYVCVLECVLEGALRTLNNTSSS
ncbi:hypothetical protein JCM10908_006323 [Rhodotorula pacifica]|uniref:uncharacterized protein n=1 Tax=Rhodotorula pacifica TaxID=1495444 RepID=UPI00317B97ED